MCKHWVAQSTSFSTAGLKFDVLEVDRSQESSRHEDAPSTSPNDPDRSSDLGHSVVRKCCMSDRPRVIQKDAQVQTSSKKKTSRRRRQKASRSRPTNGGILRREQDESMLDSSTAIFRSDFPDRTARKEDSRLSVRFLENKRAEYINKFTAVKRQIEEITTTLKETCCSGESWRGEKRDEEDDADSTEKKKIPAEEDEIVGESVDDPEGVEWSLDVADVICDNETPVFSGQGYSRNVIASTMNPRSGADDAFACDCMLTMKQMLRPRDESAGNFQQRRAKCRLGRQIPLQDQDLTEDDESREFPGIGDRSPCEVYLRNRFTAANDDEDATEDFTDSAGPRFRRPIADEKVGEIAVLNDIKRRIDRDFDRAKSENDTEDYSLPAPQKSIDLHNDGGQLHRSPTTGNSTETRQTLNSTWVDATSELSNKNSTLSVYHSCTQFPSFVSLRENGDELALEAEDDDSYLNSQSNADCYDLSVRSNADYPRVPSDTHSQSIFNFAQLHEEENVAQDTFTSEYSYPSKFLSEVIDESGNIFGGQESTDNRAYDCESKESRVDFERQYADTTFETSKSSRCIGSMDSGVFVNSSLLDLRPHENSFDEDRPNASERKQRRARTRELRGSSRTFDFSSDSSNCRTDDTLDRRINDVIKDLTKNLVLCERRVRMRLREMRKSGLKPRETRRVCICELCRLGSPRRCLTWKNVRLVQSGFLNAAEVCLL